MIPTPPHPVPGLVGQRIGSVRGIEVRAHFTWFLFIVVVAVMSGISATLEGGEGALPLWAGLPFGLATALILFGSIFLHELAHAIAASRVRIAVRRVVLVMFMGTIEFERSPRTPGEELAIYAAGPVLSFLLAGAGFAVSLGLGLLEAPHWLLQLALHMALLNTMLVLINVLPAVPMDGSRVLRALRWRQTGDLLASTREAATAGRVSAVLLGSMGFVALLLGQAVGILLLPFGWIAYRHADLFEREAEVQALFSGVKVRDLMRPVTAAVPSRTTIAAAMETFYAQGTLRELPVVDGERFLGWIVPDLWSETEPRQWDWMTVNEYLLPIDSRPAVAPDDEVTAALLAAGASPEGTAPVMEGNCLLGFVNRADIEAFAALRRSAGV
jgi:Zn-dependent protease